MDLLEEINLQEELEAALFRRIAATEPPDVAKREYLYIQITNLNATFDMMRAIGGQSSTGVGTGSTIQLDA